MAVPVLIKGDKKHVLRVSVYEAWLRRAPGLPILMVEEKLAEEFGLSVSTVRRYIKEINDNGYYPRTKPRQGRKVYAWDEEAINFLKAFYLAAQREVGYCTMRNAYNKTKEAAELKGWRIGSEQSAYVHLRDIHGLLLTYASGGNRALDNIFYIARDLSLLLPFQVVVGDQHQFDFWVNHNGQYVRPYCYAWLDMRTRLVYGIDFSAHSYNYRHVARSLKMGILRFGKFQSTYNDNGSAEKSEKVSRLIDSLQTYGMAFKDTSDLYKTREGKYAIEDDTGNALCTVENAIEWRKQNRRMFAQVKNAKAKPIERFFRTLEVLLLDDCLPGYVRDLRASAAEDEEATRRLDYQKRNGLILSYEEFIERVKQAIMKYESRNHAGLKRSPREELIYAQEQQGWEPVWINESDVRYIFLDSEKRTVKGNRITISGITFVGPNLTKDMVTKNRDNLVGLSGKKIEGFFDPDDLEAGAWAVDPRDGHSIYLKPEDKINPFNADELAEQINEKRTNMKAISGVFRETAKVAGTVLTAPTYKPLIDAKEETEKRIEVIHEEFKEKDEDSFRSEVAFLLAKEQKEKPQKQTVYKNPRERYKAIVDSIISGCSLAAEDRLFKTSYEDGLSEEEKIYWGVYINQQEELHSAT